MKVKCSALIPVPVLTSNASSNFYMETAEVKNDLGTVRVSDQVIAVIAREAALHVKGIYGMDDRFSHGISAVISDAEAEGVRVSIRENGIVIDLYVAAWHGERLPAIALQLQEAVKESVGDSTGLRVNAVNVNVERIVFGEEK